MSQQPAPEMRAIAKGPSILEPPLTTMGDSTARFNNLVNRGFVAGISGDSKASTEEVEIGANPPEPQHEEPVVTRKELWSYYCKHRRIRNKSYWLILFISSSIL
jgi:hypothetical protein